MSDRFPIVFQQPYAFIFKKRIIMYKNSFIKVVCLFLCCSFVQCDAMNVRNIIGVTNKILHQKVRKINIGHIKRIFLYDQWNKLRASDEKGTRALKKFFRENTLDIQRKILIELDDYTIMSEFRHRDGFLSHKQEWYLMKLFWDCETYFNKNAVKKNLSPYERIKTSTLEVKVWTNTPHGRKLVPFIRTTWNKPGCDKERSVGILFVNEYEKDDE